MDPEPGRGFSPNYLLWNSMLIDRGNPAPLERWEAPWVTVTNGRRDIGPYEYKFATPTAGIGAHPAAIVTPGQAVELDSVSIDDDSADPLGLRWELSDGSTSTAARVTRVYARRGTYRERLTATDPTGRSDTVELAIRVVRQRLSGLRVRPRRISAGRKSVVITYRLAAYGEVRLRIERAVRRNRGRRVRWARVGGFSQASPPGRTRVRASLVFGDDVPAAGRYRLVAKTPGAPPVRAGVRVLE